jgi:hypothetical protein
MFKTVGKELKMAHQENQKAVADARAVIAQFTDGQGECACNEVEEVMVAAKSNGNGKSNGAAARPSWWRRLFA